VTFYITLGNKFLSTYAASIWSFSCVEVLVSLKFKLRKTTLTTGFTIEIEVTNVPL
jgi:hypothetical protein